MVAEFELLPVTLEWQVGEGMMLGNSNQCAWELANKTHIRTLLYRWKIGHKKRAEKNRYQQLDLNHLYIHLFPIAGHLWPANASVNNPLKTYVSKQNNETTTRDALQTNSIWWLILGSTKMPRTDAEAINLTSITFLLRCIFD